MKITERAQTLEEVVDQIAIRFESIGLAYGHDTNNAWDEAAWIVLHTLGEDLSSPGYDWDRVLDDTELGKIDGVVHKRIESRRPFAYLVNETWFAGRSYYIDDRVIVPRSYIAEWILEQFSPWISPDRINHILDLCTGCGCIAIALAYAFHSASVMASDLSTEALEVAAINVARHKMEKRVRLHQGDMFDGIDQRFDLIVCNPPYVSDDRMLELPPEYLCEPDQAFRGGKDGLDFITPLLKQARKYLTDEGVLVIEAGSASHVLERYYSRIPFNWLSTEYDEMVIFLITAAELDQYQTMLNG